MAVDRTKILEAAQKHLSKGAHDKAIVELRKLVSADPSDVRTWLKIGDLHLKLNQRPQAVDTYSRVADQYADQGFFHKAVAVYRQILNLDPGRLDIELKLGEMHEAMQLTIDAMSAYEHVAAEYGRLGDVDRALETFARMVRLDPTSIPTTIKYAEALSRAGRVEQAAAAFEQGASLLKAQGRIDDYIKVVERLLFHREDVERSSELANLYLERQDGKRALAKLQIVFKADPKSIPTLELLARAFEQIQQLPKTISVLREIALLHGEQGRLEDRARTLQRILSLDPGDAEARRALAQMAGPARSTAPAARDVAPPPGAVIEPSRSQRAVSEPPEELDPELEELDEDFSDDDEPVAFIDDEGAPIEASPGEALAANAADGFDDAGVGDADAEVLIVEDDPLEAEGDLEPRPSLPPDVAQEANIAKLMTEVDVFLRYGLKDKVLEQLRRVIALDARHVEAHEKLKDLLVETGEIAAAVDEHLALADLFAADKPSVAVLYLRKAQELEPSNPVITERLALLEPVVQSTALEARRASLPPSPMPSVAPRVEPARGVQVSSASFRPPPREVEASPRRGLVPRPIEARPDPSSIAEGPRVDAGDGEPTFSDDRTLADVGQRVSARPAPSRDLLAPISPEEFESVPLRPSAPSLPEVERMSMPPGEVEEILDEAEFFVAQGLFQEGLQVIRDALAAHPNNRLLGDRAAEIEEQAARASRALASEAPQAADNSFELAEKLADEFDVDPSDGSDVLDVEEVFAQFKKGVAQQVPADDSDTHFDLGIAYKEMGLYDDAIHEFSLCLANPARECMAHTMIGLSNVEKGDLVAAVSAFKKGLYIDHKTDREEMGLYFELGRVYEAMNDPQEAIYYYEKVRKRDPSFLNVQERIDALATTTPAQAPPAAASTSELDAAFDDLMSKD